MRCLWLTTVLSLFQLASATVQNITVDDQNGGPDGTSINYQPAGAWVQGAIGGCDDCPPPPISSQAFMNTFHGSLFNENNSKRIQNPPLATLVFVGSSVSVNCILSNALSDPVGISQMTFSIDGIQRSTYVHTPTGSPDFDPTTVFTFSDLSLANHTLEIKNGNAGEGSSLIILDSITYSFDDLSSTPSSVSDPASATSIISSSSSPTGAVKSSNTAAIAGGVIAALAVILLVALAFLYIRRRRLQHRSNVPLSTSMLSPIGRIGSLFHSHPKPPPDMAPVPFPTPTHPVSHNPSPRASAPAAVPPPPPSSGSRISRLSFNPNLLVGRWNRRPPPPAILTRAPPNTPNARLSAPVPASPALPSGNPLLRAPSASPPEAIASIQQWQRRTQEEMANEPIPIIHPLDMSEVDLSSHYDESSISSPPPPAPPPPPRTPQAPQRRFTVMNN